MLDYINIKLFSIKIKKFWSIIKENCVRILK